MANVKDLKVRIASTSSTLKITSAMKLVSAAKLAKAQAKIQGFKPYSNELDQTVRMASALAESYTHEYLKEKSNDKLALVIVSSEKGLCGGYNSQLYKVIKTFYKENADKEIKLYFIGKKVRELLKRDGVVGEKTFTFKKTDPSFQEIKNISEEIAAMFTADEVGSVHVAFNSFVSAIEYTSGVKKVLPMTVTEEEKKELAGKFPVDFKYEPSAEQILDTVIPEVLNTTVFASVLDASAAEHSSRMSAMDNATKNSQEMIKTLTLKMNKLRQAAITTELTEIVSGAESLNS